MRRIPLTLALIPLLLLQAQDRRIVPAAPAPRRLALVIGNKDYTAGLSPLTNPVNDATDLAATLRDLGFTVTLATNLDRQGLDQTVRAFADSVRPGDSALFFFSGHGIEFEGQNYLIPVDFELRTKEEVPHQALSASLVQDRLKAREARATILILDACRNNPFDRSAAGGGLSSMSGKGVYVAFAAAPGTAADDNRTERNGKFTKHLLTEIREPGLSIDEVFNRVRQKVADETAQKQVPFSTSGLIGGFVFHDPALDQARYAAAQAEMKRLEDELRAAEKERDQARTEQAKADAAHAEEAARGRLELQRIEQDRLAKEAARSRELEAERRKLEDDETARAKERAAAEARLADLRRRQTASPAVTADLTLDKARARLAGLTGKIEKVRKSVEASKAAALKKLSDDYAPLLAKLPVTSPKLELETTEEYYDRLAEIKKNRQAVEDRYTRERAQTEKQFEAELEIASAPFSAEIEALRKRSYVQRVAAVWSSYDADSQILTIRAGALQYRFAVPLEKARQMAGRKDSLVFETDAELEISQSAARRLLGSARLVDAVSGDRYARSSDESGNPVLTSGMGNIRTKVNPKDGLNYVWIGPGSFTMGCSPGDSECYPDEKPSKQVTISTGFWIGQTDVTQEAYQRVIGSNPSRFKGPKHPVETVNWTEAENYCQATGMRLPTEAEWEYAARAGTAGSRYGDVDSIAWYSANSGSKTHDVATKEPNAWGLYDILGNVWQWTADWYEPNKTRTLRGGSGNNGPWSVRVSYRDRNEPGVRNNEIGVRCVGDSL